MKIIALADIHGLYSALEPLAAEIAAADIVLLVGDITHFGREDAAEEVLRVVEQHSPNVLGVAGNCDHQEVARHLVDRGMSLDTRCAVRGGIAFVGVGGSLPCPGTTPNEMSEAQFGQHSELAFAEVPADTPVVMVVHQPPYGTVADAASSGQHVGSKSVREAIERYQPLICLTGHIHESIGVGRIGLTTVVNPGPARDGRYAWMEISEQMDHLTVECRSRG